MDLIIEGKGAFIGKHQGRIRVYREQKVTHEAPLLHLKQIVIVDSGVSISSDVVQACSEEGIAIHFLGRNGKNTAGLYAAGLVGTVLTRRAQLLAYNGQQSITLGKAFVSGKLENQMNLVRYFGKSREENKELTSMIQLVTGDFRDAQDDLKRLQGENIADVREQILSIEGRAAQKYWSVVKAVIPEAIQWPGRETRGAKDLFNAVLNYGYGVLYAQVEQAVILAGLDPYAGFLHADRPGSPAWYWI